ncbi:unnamed protein product, partial [Ceratitis capitata]
VLSTIAFIVALILLVCVCLFLASRFSKRQFKTVVEDTHPLYKEAKAKFLLPAHRNTSKEELFTEIIGLYDTFTFGRFDRFETLGKAPLHELNYVNFTAVARFMAWRCWELLTNCQWRSHVHKCCDIFMERRSQLGFCLAFNTIEVPKHYINDSTWPWRTDKGGRSSGLRLKVVMNEQQHLTGGIDGVTVMIVEPNVWYYIPIDIPGQTRTRLTLDAFLNKYDEETRRVSSSVRGCVFKDEQNSDDFKTLHGHRYRFENCQAQCQQEHLKKYYYLINFEIPGQEKYMINKYPGIVCSCFVSCDSLRYLIAIKTRPLTPAEAVANRSVVDLEVYFDRDFIIKYRTSLIFTWVDLIVSFGGTTGLFLGCSLISLVELVYFFFIKAPRRIRMEHERPLQLKRRPSKVEQSKIKLQEYREMYKLQQKY